MISDELAQAYAGRRVLITGGLGFVARRSPASSSPRVQTCCSSTRSYPNTADWLDSSRRLATWLQRFSSAHPRTWVVFGWHDPLFNTNSLELASELDLDRRQGAGYISGSVAGDTVAANRRQLSEPAFGSPNVVVTTDRYPAYQFAAHVTQTRVIRAARQLGFRKAAAFSLPDGRTARVWVRQGQPSA